MTKPQFLMDTSALRGIRRLHLAALANNLELSVSPFSIWELLCHLDRGVDWQRARGHLALAAAMKIRHDPFAELAESAGAAMAANRSRFEDREMISRICALAMSCNSLSEFYKSEVHDMSGGTRLIDGVSERTRTLLHEEEDLFVANVIETIIIAICRAGEMTTESSIALLIYELAHAAASNLAQKFSEEKNTEATNVDYLTANLYIYIGYRLLRSVEYLENIRLSLRTIDDVRALEAVIDRNDTEDAYICLHLCVLRPLGLVTADKGTHRIVKSVLRYASQIYKEKTLATVYTNREFLELSARAATDDVAFWRSLSSHTTPEENWHWALGQLGITWRVP